MKRICPRCNNELSTNCYVKDKGINTLSYLELIIKKDQFNKKHKEIKSCYCPKCGYVELYVDVNHQNQHLKKDDDLNSLRQTVRQYAIDYHQRIELERKKNERKEIPAVSSQVRGIWPEFSILAYGSSFSDCIRCGADCCNTELYTKKIAVPTLTS